MSETSGTTLTAQCFKGLAALLSNTGTSNRVHLSSHSDRMLFSVGKQANLQVYAPQKPTREGF